jgi:MFS family permease
MTGISSMIALYYVAGMYSMTWLVKFCNYTPTAATWQMLLNQTVAIVFCPVVGYMADQIGVAKSYFINTVFAIVTTVPTYLFCYIYPQNQVLGMLVTGSTFGVAQALSAACYHWVAELFPSHIRGLAVSTYYSVGTAVGGFAPMIISASPHVLTAAYYTTVCSAISSVVVAVALVLHSTVKPSPVATIRDEPY